MRMRVGAGLKPAPTDFCFLKRAVLFLNISSLSKASAEIPPFPPLKKGGGGGIQAISKS